MRIDHRPVARLAACLCLALMGCAGSSSDRDAVEGSSAASTGATSAGARPFTFFLSLDDDIPQRQLVIAGKTIRITARDPKPAEVERQSDMGAATVTIGALAIKGVQEDKPAILDIEVRYSPAGDGALDVIRPSANDLARVMRPGGSYELSASRSRQTTSSFFSEVDLTFDIE
jgi:hypothetical protein